MATEIYNFLLRNGELICQYRGDPPNMTINEQGQLIWHNAPTDYEKGGNT